MVLAVICGRSKELNASQNSAKGLFPMEIDVPSDRRDLGEKHRRHAGGARRTCRVFLRNMSYEVKTGEPSKLHLTTTTVTSSLKSSPQKSAAVL
jgi:hypothetical protein